MARTQSGMVAAAITAATGRAIELVGVTTEGDVSTAHIATIGGTGVFVNGVRDRLLSGEIDFAVHSLKDLPTTPAEGIALAAVPSRDDPRDALCGPCKLADLPAGARVGTGSTRRVAQLRALRPDIEVVPIRGNADTRLRKATDGELDAVVLAYAGLVRIGRTEEISEIFDPEAMLPSPGQGALAVECRADRVDLVALLAAIDDAETRQAVTAERAMLNALGAGCSAPVGAYAARIDQKLCLTGAVIGYDGRRRIRLSETGKPHEADRVGRDLAARLMSQGADQLIGERAS
jgi:hydroxymethylbilane synthase